MAYLTVEKMKQYFDFRILVKLTDDTGILDPNDELNVDDTIVQLYIDDALDDIYNYLRNIYTDVAPGAVPTDEIVTLGARMAWCSLWERRGQEPTQVSKMRERCYDKLHMLATLTSDQRRASTNKSKVSTINRQ